MDSKERFARAATLYDEVRAAYQDENLSAEAKSAADAKLAEAQKLIAEAEQLRTIEAKALEMAQAARAAQPSAPVTGFANFGQYLKAVADYGDIRNLRAGYMPHPALAMLGNQAKAMRDGDEENAEQHAKQHGSNVKSAWGGATKTMVENTGALGGFTVPTEFVPNLIAVTSPYTDVVARGATNIPMRRRAVQVPALDQTGSTAGTPNWFGGVKAQWTEEAQYKTATEPKFRQIELVAHKLVCFALTSDELLDDNAIGLASFFSSPMGFRGAIEWQREWAFLRGTGAGMPRGIVGAGATINVPAAAAGQFTWADALQMLEHFLPSTRGYWIINQAHLHDVYGMVDGGGTAIFTANINDPAPGKLYGYPIVFSDKLPAPGVAGSVLLVDPAYYYMGERGAPTLDSTNAEYFRYDETSWRSVYRVDGQPGISAPITLEDGTTQVSPFVQLGAKAT